MKTHSNLQRTAIFVFLLAFLIAQGKSFEFREVLVSADTVVTNAVATYTLGYEHHRTNTFATTAWQTTFLSSADTVTATFPNEFTLTSSITCRYSLNSTGAYSNANCGLVGNVITLSNIFNNDIVHTFSLIVTNVQNPYPAGTTSVFSGTIGADTSFINAFSTNSRVTIAPAASICSFTFTPTTVNSNTANLMMTLTTVN